MDISAITAAEWQVIRLSLWVALCATFYSLPLALWVAYILARKEFWGRAILNAIVHLPLVLPPVVTGYLLLVVFGKFGPLGQWLDVIGITLAFTPAGAALAAAVMAFPLMVRAIRLSIEGVDQGLEDAAKTLGAGRMGVFFHVTLPLIRPGLIAAAILGFAKALGEFGATITFVSNIPGQTQTIASAIYALLQVPGQEAAVVRMIVFSMVLSFGALLVSEYLARKGQG